VARRAFYSTDDYPLLETVRKEWQTIRDEAKVALATLEAQLGDKTGGPSWILPLIPEAEDEHMFTEDVWRKARELSPVTCSLVQKLPFVIAFAFSKLVPGTKIPLHEHWNPYLTAILCLQDADGKTHITVNGERRHFHDGEYVFFDYTLPHESVNEGTVDRIVMLLLVDRRKPKA
jgi:beta-hydroxylase